MPDQSSAASEHAIIQEITAPLATLPDDAVSLVADADFPIVLRGYDRVAVEAYVRKASQLVAELQATRSPEAAVRRALERVGEQISGILQRAHETSAQITNQSRREAEERLEVARAEAAQIRSEAERRVRELDAETDRVWSERFRIVEDVRDLGRQLAALADTAADRFPAADDTYDETTGERTGEPLPVRPFPAHAAGTDSAAAETVVDHSHEPPPVTADEDDDDSDETAVMPKIRLDPPLRDEPETGA